jgi:hypothetical protein
MKRRGKYGEVGWKEGIQLTIEVWSSVTMLITLVGCVGKVPTVLTSRSELATGAPKTEATKGRASRMEVNRIVLDDLLVG